MDLVDCGSVANFSTNFAILADITVIISLLLQEEAVGMAFPIDASYFDQFPLIHDDELCDIAGQQYPRSKDSQQ